jgi:hypothetical protein
MSDGSDVDVHAQDERMRQKALGRALDAARSDVDIIVGPWTGEVGFELLYWIPFLNWLVDHAASGRRMVVVSRGGAAMWYRHLTTRHVDILDLVTPDEFRKRTAGKKKQYHQQHEFDQELIAEVRRRLELSEGPVIHPSAMFRLFAALWRRRATIDLVESFSSFRSFTPPAVERPANLPAGYVVAKFYFSKAFPDTSENRSFIADVLRRLSREVPVALLSTSLQLDEHVDYQTRAGSGLFVVDPHGAPEKNLERQTHLIASASRFVGTYGGFSYLAPFYGVPSLSFFSRQGFEPHHLELAQRVFGRLLPGGFRALDRRGANALEFLGGTGAQLPASASVAR